MANNQYNDVEKIFSPGVLIPEPKFIPPCSARLPDLLDRMTLFVSFDQPKEKNKTIILLKRYIPFSCLICRRRKPPLTIRKIFNSIATTFEIKLENFPPLLLASRLLNLYNFLAGRVGICHSIKVTFIFIALFKREN